MKNFGINKEEDWDYITKNSIKYGDDGKYRLSYDPKISANLQQQSSDNVELWDIWHKLKMPIMLIWGEKSDILLKDTVIKMQANENLELHIVKNTGHAPCLLDLDEIKVIEKWLTKIN